MTQQLHALLRHGGLEPPGHLQNQPVSQVCCDSRLVQAGSLFIGLPGSRVDGGCLWPEALAAGAVAAVIGAAAAAQRPPAAEDPVLVVADPLAAWAGRLAAAFWRQPSQAMRLIGVTGTNGKTTTTSLIEHLAAEAGRPAALFGTLVNRWPGHSHTAEHTTAFADQLQAQLAAALAAGTQVAAMEVSSHALDQQRVAGCSFAAAVFTNLSQDHLDYHASMEAYFEAKALLFAPDQALGGAVVNVDDPWGAQLAQRLESQSPNCRLWRSSLDDGPAELRLTDLRFGPSGIDGTLISPVGSGAFRSPLVGRFNAMNLLQAVGVLALLELPLPLLLQGLASFQGVPGRMQRVAIAGLDAAAASQLPGVIVDYAHTPDGLENALGAARPFCDGRLICVFGCGGDRDRGKRPLMGEIAARLADQVWVTSDNPRTEDPAQILQDVVAGIPAGSQLQVEAERAIAIAAAIAGAAANDLVIIAGKGHEDYQILGTTKIHFDDREHAETALRAKLGGL